MDDTPNIDRGNCCNDNTGGWKSLKQRAVFAHFIDQARATILEDAFLLIERALLVDVADRRPVLYYPHRPMRQWVLSVPHPLRYLFANQPKIMGKVLGIVYCTLATHLIHKPGYKKPDAHTGAVTLIQRFGGALNLNIHFHLIFLDGVYVDRGGKLDRFRWGKAPTTAELSQLTYTIAYRIGRYLDRQGLLVRDAEQRRVFTTCAARCRPCPAQQSHSLRTGHLKPGMFGEKFGFL